MLQGPTLKTFNKERRVSAKRSYTEKHWELFFSEHFCACKVHFVKTLFDACVVKMRRFYCSSKDMKQINDASHLNVIEIKDKR